MRAGVAAALCVTIAAAASMWIPADRQAAPDTTEHWAGQDHEVPVEGASQQWMADITANAERLSTYGMRDVGGKVVS